MTPEGEIDCGLLKSELYDLIRLRDARTVSDHYRFFLDNCFTDAVDREKMQNHFEIFLDEFGGTTDPQTVENTKFNREIKNSQDLWEDEKKRTGKYKILSTGAYDLTYHSYPFEVNRSFSPSTVSNSHSPPTVEVEPRPKRKNVVISDKVEYFSAKRHVKKII